MMEEERVFCFVSLMLRSKAPKREESKGNLLAELHYISDAPRLHFRALDSTAVPSIGE